MFNPHNYLAQVVETLFVCQKIAFCSFVRTLLCLYFRRYQLILKTKYKIWRVLSHCGQSYIQLKTPLFFYLNFFHIKLAQICYFLKGPWLLRRSLSHPGFFQINFYQRAFQRDTTSQHFFVILFKCRIFFFIQTISLRLVDLCYFQLKS